MKDIFKFNLQRFADIVENSVNKTTDDGLSAEMKTFYSDYIIDNAEPELVHSQFGQKRTIPKNGGKTIEFRKYKPYEAAGKLEEGVTPEGNKLAVSTIEATLDQYGDYTAITDVVDLTAIDNNLLEASKLHGAQAGLTSDNVVREVLNGGDNVYYAGGAEGRMALDAAISVADIKMAVRMLKRMNAKKIKGDYVAIIHPDVAHDLTSDPAWVEAHKYASPEEIYNGEIGKLYGVRFVETSEAKIFKAAGSIGAGEGFVSEYGETPDIYSTLVIAENAYGTIDLAGGNLKHIFKNFGSGGTSDPLDQRATVGFKFMQTAVRLVDEYMVRIESLATA